MKISNIFAGFVLLLSSFIFSNCTRETLDDKSTAKEIISGNKWSVGYYFAGHDKTAQYSLFQFSFNSDGTLEATDNIDFFNGTWKVMHDVNNKEVLMVDLNTQGFLSELNLQWNITNAETSLLTMQSANCSQLLLNKL